jgi:hypothetical protein
MGFRHEIRTTTSAGCLDLLVGGVRNATCEQTGGACSRYDHACAKPGTSCAIACAASIPSSGYS